MSEQIPTEFEWIKPGVKVTHKFSKQEHIVRSSVYFDGSDWKFHIVVNGLSLPVHCENVFQPNQSSITLTLTRKQAQDIAGILADVLHYGPSKDLEWLKNKIEENLK